MWAAPPWPENNTLMEAILVEAIALMGVAFTMQATTGDSAGGIAGQRFADPIMRE